MFNLEVLLDKIQNNGCLLHSIDQQDKFTNKSHNFTQHYYIVHTSSVGQSCGTCQSLLLANHEKEKVLAGQKEVYFGTWMLSCVSCVFCYYLLIDCGG